MNTKIDAVQYIKILQNATNNTASTLNFKNVNSVNPLYEAINPKMNYAAINCYDCYDNVKKRFCLSDFADGKYCMLCDSPTRAEKFCQYLHEHGRHWGISTAGYNDSTFYWMYGENTVYQFNDGDITSKSKAESAGYTILKYDDYAW